MRPTVGEQLQGLRRILEEVVAPELANPYPADILAGVCGTLEAIAAGWVQVPEYLHWDAEESARILTELQAAVPALDPELSAAISGAVAAGAGSSAELPPVAALEARTEQLRAALVRAAPVIMADDDPATAPVREHLVAHFKERAARYPLRSVWRPGGAPAPAQPSTGQSSAH